MALHRWADTVASELFIAGVHIADRCYATRHGIAFEAKPTADGTWHGYPIPWISVPASLRKKWLLEELVTSIQIKHTLRAGRNDIGWAVDWDVT